jgi:galactokinase/mevalonate kinase-like predicted kinase
MSPFDICVLTAANEIQAEGYRKQLTWRKEHGLLPENTEFLVYADPKGHRVGAGGSTIYVLSKLLEKFDQNFKKAFQNKRILILHSGGDSRRLPAYSAVGKIFTPLPTNTYHALFDVLLDNFQQLPVLEEGHVIIGSGDVVLNFHPSFVAFSPSGITGVAYPEEPAVASHHGVYVVPASYHEQNPCNVQDFLQKPDRATLKSAEALDHANRALIDTGIMNFALDAVETIVTLPNILNEIIQGNVLLDLYTEIAFAILGKQTLQGDSTLSTLNFYVSVLPYCGFFHVGKSQELLRNLYSLTHAGALCKFKNFTRTTLRSHPHLKNAYVFNSMITTEQISINMPALIEGSHISTSLHLEGENIVTGVPKNSGVITLKKGICLTIIPLKDEKWASVIYGINDSFKNDRQPTFLNQPFQGWLEKRNIGEHDIWHDGDEKELWRARLFPVHQNPALAIDVALNLQNNRLPDTWRSFHRLSLQEILALTDHSRVLDQFARIEKRSKLESFQENLVVDSNLSLTDLLSWCQNDLERLELSKKLVELIGQTKDVLQQSRFKKYLSHILRDVSHQGIVSQKPDIFADPAHYEDEAFSDIRLAIGKGLKPIQALEQPRLQIRSDEVVWVSVPVRLDFGGGWSDTPPYCFEQGGSVLNAAVKLNGQYPIQVIGKRLAEPYIRINSIDLGSSQVMTELATLFDYTNPADWLSLPKAGFVAAGILSKEMSGRLSEKLQEWGGGLDLTLFSALPSGSGLGTSSILGSAIIICLANMFGVQLSQHDIFQRTLYLEQLMTTGGGWQDQIGGVVGGTKLIQTTRGIEQTPVISWTHLEYPGFELSERFLLYYTGYRRMAKNILRQIVGRYLERDHTTLECIAKLKALSVQMKEFLDRRDIDSFGECIGTVWKLNKRLDEGATTEQIEKLLASISQEMCGAKLLGAGGGGFLFIVSKSTCHTQRIKQILTENPPNARARFFDFNVDPKGMLVSVL